MGGQGPTLAAMGNQCCDGEADRNEKKKIEDDGNNEKKLDADLKKVKQEAASDAALAGKRITLLIIDPQLDFHSGGSLAVPGSDEDAQRTAALISRTCSLLI